MQGHTVLIVDDSSVDLEIISIVCNSLGCEVDVVANGFEAIELYAQKQYDLVLCDYCMEPANGVYVVSRILEQFPEAQCIMISGYPDAELRAFVEQNDLLDLMVKPFRADALKQCMWSALNQGEAVALPLSGVALSNRMDSCPPLVGDCPDVKALRHQLASIIHEREPFMLVGHAELPSSVLLELAHFIHENSYSAGGACVTMDIRGYSEEDLQSYLIDSNGHLGLQMKRAEHGTLILRHADSLPLSIQKLIADFLDQIAAHTRLILLVAQSIDESLAAGSLEDSFYFKIAANSIEIPQNMAV
jgi:DNA-binding NtrC family response regulator